MLLRASSCPFLAARARRAASAPRRAISPSSKTSIALAHRAPPRAVASPRAIGLTSAKNTFQSGFLSILYSIGSKPLQIWDKKVCNGHIKRITDNDIQSSVLEIMSTNISTCFILYVAPSTRSTRSASSCRSS